MRIKILQQDLVGPLQSVSRSAGIKAALPVLSNILFEAENTSLKLSATNLEVGVIREIPAEVIEGGAITIPSKTLNEVISSLSGNQIELYTEGELLKIKSGKFNADLNGISASEFPAIPQATNSGFEIPKDIFKQAIPQVSFASAVDEGRPVLTGILTEIIDGKFEVVATDGFRLAHKSFSNEKLKGVNFKALIPRRTLDELVKLAGEENQAEVIEVSVTDNLNQVVFKVGRTVLSSRLIEGNFPTWEKIIPSQFLVSALVEKEEFVKGLKLASVFARTEANVIKLNLKKGGIQITSETRELGHQDAVVEAEVTGEEMVVAFNFRYLIDAVSVCPGEKLKINFSGVLSPTLITPEGDLKGLEYIVMPIRIN